MCSTLEICVHLYGQALKKVNPHVIALVKVHYIKFLVL
jgi:hypothetical protein